MKPISQSHTDDCDHIATIQLLHRLNDSGDFSTVVKTGMTSVEKFESQNDTQSFDAAVQIRHLVLSALHSLNAHEQLLDYFEQTYAKYADHENNRAVFFAHSAAIATSDVHWEKGNRERAVNLLTTAIDRFQRHEHAAFRTLSVRASVDKAICLWQDDQQAIAIDLLTSTIVSYADDLAASVQEEFCRAANQRQTYLVALESR